MKSEISGSLLPSIEPVTIDRTWYDLCQETILTYAKQLLPIYREEKGPLKAVRYVSG